MPDREKVIERLTGLKELLKFQKDILGYGSFIEDINDALALLKEQETSDTGKTRVFQCEKCGYGIDDIYLSNEHDFDVFPHFCPNCGRSVKWE